MEHARHHGAVGHASAEDEYLETPPGASHEHTDANVWIIVKFGVWLVISAIVIHIGLGFLFAFFVKQSEEATQQFPLATGQEQRLPAEPRLQRFPVNEIYDYRQREDAVLRQYGWVDKNGGVVRLPIADAMRLAVERGLPARAPQAALPPTEPSTPGQAQSPAPVEQTQTLGLMPADSSSGRTMERRRQ